MAFDPAPSIRAAWQRTGVIALIKEEMPETAKCFSWR
jgi:hypothetical protein